MRGKIGWNWGGRTHQFVPFISKSDKCSWLISLCCFWCSFSKFFANFSYWYIESVHVFVFFCCFFDQNLLFQISELNISPFTLFISLLGLFLGFATLVFVCFFVFMKKIVEEVLLIYGLHPSWPDLTSGNEADSRDSGALGRQRAFGCTFSFRNHFLDSQIWLEPLPVHFFLYQLTYLVPAIKDPMTY